MIPTLGLLCPKCKKELPKDDGQGFHCPTCGLLYKKQKGYFRYDFDSLLFRAFRKQYLLNKVLNNNGYLSYVFLKSGSLSDSNRQDVQAFREYITNHAVQGNLLDVGCGPTKIPGYLDFSNKGKFLFFGIDPIDTSEFLGHRVVGCCEFLPYPDGFFETVIFATSLDHVCSLKKSLEETKRVLKRNGVMIIWMSDRGETIFEKIWRKWERWRKARQYPFGIEGYYAQEFGRYVRYPEYNVVLYIPSGGVDPFHSFFESPTSIRKMASPLGFQEIHRSSTDKNHVFLTFKNIA